MRSKTAYEYLKATHRCVRCRKRDAYTLNGRIYCAECAELQRLYQKKRRENPEIREKLINYSRQYAQARREAGLCTSCGRKTVPPYVTCPVCRMKRRRERKEKNPVCDISYLDESLCRVCRKEPRLEGKGVCEKCYARILKAQRAACEAKAKRRRGE